MAFMQKTKAAEAWHRYWVYNDPEFIEEINKLPKRPSPPTPDISAEYRRISAKYGLHWTYVDFVHDRDWSSFDPKKNVGGGIAYFNENEDGFIAELNLNVTEDQILDIYRYIRQLRSENKIAEKKYKDPEDTKLLYAVCRSRIINVPFKIIFSQYSLGTLPHYKQIPQKKYKTQKDLERYYHRYYK